MQNNIDVKKLKKIRLFSFISIGLDILYILGLLLFIIIISISSMNGEEISYGIFALIPLFIISFVVGAVFCIINAVMILSTKWTINEVEENKIIWGIFTIILLGWIASLVFSIQAIKKYNNNSNNQNNYSNNDNLANF